MPDTRGDSDIEATQGGSGQEDTDRGAPGVRGATRQWRFSDAVQAARHLGARAR